MTDGHDNKGDYMNKKVKTSNKKTWFEKCLDRIDKGKTPFKKSK